MSGLRVRIWYQDIFGQVFGLGLESKIKGQVWGWNSVSHKRSGLRSKLESHLVSELG